MRKPQNETRVEYQLSPVQSYLRESAKVFPPPVCAPAHANGYVRELVLLNTATQCLGLMSRLMYSSLDHPRKPCPELWLFWFSSISWFIKENPAPHIQHDHRPISFCPLGSILVESEAARFPKA